MIAAATRRWDAARTVAIAYGANQLVKVIVRRRRPPGGLVRTHSDLSYPSAHAATSVAAVRSLEMPVLWPLAIAFAAIGESFAALRYGAIVVAQERTALVATLERAIEVLPAPATLRTTT